MCVKVKTTRSPTQRNNSLTAHSGAGHLGEAKGEAERARAGSGEHGVRVGGLDGGGDGGDVVVQQEGLGRRAAEWGCIVLYTVSAVYLYRCILLYLLYLLYQGTEAAGRGVSAVSANFAVYFAVSASCCTHISADMASRAEIPYGWPGG